MNERSNSEQSVVEIDLLKLAAAYLRKWWLIVIFGLAGAGIALAISMYVIVPQYQASITVYVNNYRNTEKQEYVSGSDLSTAQKLVNTYTNMLTSDTVLEEVVDSTGYNYTAAEMRKFISTKQVGDTEIFKVFVTHTNPNTAAEIANAIARTAPDAIADFVEGSSTKIIDYAKTPTGRFSPSYTKNTVIGGLIGGILILAILTIEYLLDVRIKSEQDLGALCDVPVLGQIPDFSQLELKKASSKKSNYEYGGPSSKKEEKGGVTDGKE